MRFRVKAANVTVSVNSLVHVIQGSFVFPLQNKMDHRAPLLLCTSIPAIIVYYNPLKAETQRCMVTPAHLLYLV